MLIERPLTGAIAGLRGRPWPLRSFWLLSAAPLFIAVPALAAEEQRDGSSGGTDSSIIVLGQRVEPVFAGIRPEDQLDEADIASYGADAVGDLLDILDEELDGADGAPVVLINGRLSTGINEISDLPTEVVSGIQLLPREVAGRYGQAPTRRVINITIKPNQRQATAKVEGGIATAGGGERYEGELNLLNLKSNDRTSLVVRARNSEPLFESERGILADSLRQPFDIIGNVIAFPTFGAPIDPALAVAVVGLPVGQLRPTLAQLAGRAANFTDLAPVRTLLAGQTGYTANGNVTRYIGRTVVSLNGRADWNGSNGQGGRFGNTVRVPGSSPFTPFSGDVAITRYFGDTLRQENDSFGLDLGANLSAPVGRWQLNALAGYQHRVSRFANDSDYDTVTYQTGVLAGTINPFAPITPDQITARQSTGRFSGDSAQLQAILAGKLLQLPAGEVRATGTFSYRIERSNSRSDFLGTRLDRSFKRDEAGAQLNLQVPILANGASAIGDVTLDLTAEARKATRLGTLFDYGASLSWLPVSGLQFRSSVQHEEVPPAVQTLTDPVNVSENFRVFDYLANQTVLVRYLSGGNPNLRVASRQLVSFGANWRPWKQTKLTLSADYTSRLGRRIQASLPPTSAAVQAAFPDRFVRDANGVLVLVDSRPVEFARETNHQVHWGLDFRGQLARGTSGARDLGADNLAERGFSAGRALRANFAIDHYWMLESQRLARRGLQVVDLLDGGAAGYGGGLPRHTVRLTAGLSARGAGLQLNASYRSKSEVRVASLPAAGDLTFAARTVIDARVFANLGPLAPGLPFLAGSRIAFEGKNLLDSKQRVRDATGITPSRYQPYLLDSLGRTVQVSFRKVF